MGPCSSRRNFLRIAGASLLTPLMPSPLRAASNKITSPVAIARCKAYDRDAVFGQLRVMMDQLGGLAKLVAGKTVAVKVNLTGNPAQPALGLPASRTYQVHPDVVLATASLLDQAGAGAYASSSALTRRAHLSPISRLPAGIWGRLPP